MLIKCYNRIPRLTRPWPAMLMQEFHKQVITLLCHVIANRMASDDKAPLVGNRKNMFHVMAYFFVTAIRYDA